MKTNKMIVKAVKVGFILMLVLLFVYGTMKASFAAFNYGYQVAVESLEGSIIGAGDIENTEGTGE